MSQVFAKHCPSVFKQKQSNQLLDDNLAEYLANNLAEHMTNLKHMAKYTAKHMTKNRTTNHKLAIDT